MAAHEPKTDAACLAGLLERQHEVVAALTDLSRRQGERIDAGDDDGILSILAERQPLVEEFSAISARLLPFRAAWERHLSTLAPAQREQVHRRAELVSSLAAALAARDEADRRRLAARRDELADELAAMGTRRGAIAAYRGLVPGGATYQDREA